MDTTISPKMIGGGTGKERSGKDFYPTPPEVTKALMDFLQLRPDTVIWEPACGEMDMVNELVREGYIVYPSDIQTGRDFLTEPLQQCDWIITNPPFFCTEDFIRRCAGFGKPFALLVKSQYWHSAKRRELFFQIRPEYLLPLTWRPNFEFKTRTKSASLLDCIWCVWIPPYQGEGEYIPLAKPELW